MTIMQIPVDPARIKEAHDAGRLNQESWGGNETAGMMSTLVPGATSVHDCVTARWPEWLARLNVDLFDYDVGADEDDARLDFDYAVAQACSVPVDYDRARDMFLISRLDTGDHSALKTLRSLSGDQPDQIAAVDRVVGLLRRRLAGEDVAREMVDAHAAADAAADAAYADYTAWAVSYATRTAADAVSYATRTAADAAARADLIESLRSAGSQTAY